MGFILLSPLFHEIYLALSIISWDLPCSLHYFMGFILFTPLFHGIYLAVSILPCNLSDTLHYSVGFILHPMNETSISPTSLLIKSAPWWQFNREQRSYQGINTNGRLECHYCFHNLLLLLLEELNCLLRQGFVFIYSCTL